MHHAISMPSKAREAGMTQQLWPVRCPAIYLAGVLGVCTVDFCAAQGAPLTGVVDPRTEMATEGSVKTQSRLLVGSSPGGGYDTYARLIAAHLPRYLPNSPKIIVQNMPGAGSLVVSNYLSNIAPRDGSVFAAVHSLAATHPLFYPERVKYDARTMVWIGSAVRETTFGLSSTSSKAPSFQSAFQDEMIVAGSTGSTTTFPTFLNAILGTRFNVVKGYNATSAALLALERGEVNGVIGVTGPGMRGLGDRLVEEGKARVFIQFGMSRHAAHPTTDWVFDFAKRPEQRVVMNLMFGTQEFGRPFVAPPGLSITQAQTLRAAFAKVLTDELLLEEAKKRKIDIGYTSPEEIDEIITSMYQAPPDAIQLVKKLLGDQGR